MLSEQLTRIDSRLKAALECGETAFRRALSAELDDFEERSGIKFPRGFRTKFAGLVDNVARMKSLAKLRERAARGIEEARVELGNLERAVSSVLRVESPKYADEAAREAGVSGDGLGCLSDEGFLGLLARAKRFGSGEKRLVYYLHVVRAASDAVARLRERASKLAERARSDSGAEASAAAILARRMADAEGVLRRRREEAARVFFLQRRRILARLVAATAAFDACWKAPSESLARLVSRPELDVERPLGLLKEMDAAHKAVPDAPTMAAKEAMR